jgi:ferredoxin--NADP+ reductase
VREIHIIGRRGPAQAKFTNKELRELGEIPGCSAQVSPGDMALNDTSATELDDKTNFTAAKNVEILQSWLQATPAAQSRRIHLHFLLAPTRLEGNGRVQRIVLERNRLTGAPFAQRAVGIGEAASLDCDLVFRSIGYRGRAIPGVPFDDARGIIPNEAGRVTGHFGTYVTGWIKRGPSGIIGTNRADAVSTVQCLQEDLAKFDAAPKPGADGLFAAAGSHASNVIDYTDWLRIDAEEQRRGAAAHKPREKFTRVADMLACAASS